MQEITMYVHDIKNKLSVINLHCESMAKKFPEINLRPIVGASQRAGELLSSLLSTFLHTKSAQVATLHLTPQDAFGDCQTIVAILRQIYQIKIELSLDVTNLSAVFLYDSKIMSQVLENLCENSYKSGANQISIVLKNTDTFITLEVTDLGPDGPLPFFVSNVRLPNGIGKNIVVSQLNKINATCIWTETELGMSAMITFPIISQI